MRVKIYNLGMNGEGVARLKDSELKNKVCFVNFALPNELVDIEIVENKTKYCTGELKQIVEESKDRVSPKCPYFTKCGGCDLQHLSLDKQREFKVNKVKETLRNVVDDGVIRDIEYASEFGYRNKMVFALREEGGKKKIGMFQYNSHSVVEIDKCLLTSDNINEILRVSREFFENSNLTAYNEKEKSGDIKYIVIREYNGSTLVTIVATRRINLKAYYDMLSRLNIKIGLSIVKSTQDREILAGDYHHLYGIEYLDIEELGIKYRINNLGFMQVNNEMKKRMYTKVLDNISKADTVIDAYSGAGLLSAIMTHKARQVIGIEINKSASLSAVDLAKRNCLQNIRFINDDVESVIDRELIDCSDAILVLDPPRSGCSRGVCESILKCAESISKIIYISCNPSTLARDLNLLQSRFEVISVTPYDLFPETKHVETLVVLERKD